MANPLKLVAKRLVYGGLPVPRCVRPLIRGMYRGGVWGVEALAVCRKVFWIEPVLRAVCADVGRGLRAERLPFMRGVGRLRLGNEVYLSGRSCFYFLNGMPEMPEIVVGDRTFIGNGCTLAAGRRIEIGAHCLLAAGVRIHDNDGHPLDPARRRAGEPIRQDETAAVRIGDNVWIGADSLILKGVTIGHDAVVAAGAIVTHDVPPATVVAGNPARPVRQLAAAGEQE